jgi:hypothetical protein
MFTWNFQKEQGDFPLTGSCWCFLRVKSWFMQSIPSIRLSKKNAGCLLTYNLMMQQCQKFRRVQKSSEEFRVQKANEPTSSGSNVIRTTWISPVNFALPGTTALWTRADQAGFRPRVSQNRDQFEYVWICLNMFELSQRCQSLHWIATSSLFKSKLKRKIVGYRWPDNSFACHGDFEACLSSRADVSIVNLVMYAAKSKHLHLRWYMQQIVTVNNTVTKSTDWLWRAARKSRRKKLDASYGSMA